MSRLSTLGRVKTILLKSVSDNLPLWVLKPFLTIQIIYDIPNICLLSFISFYKIIRKIMFKSIC